MFRCLIELMDAESGGEIIVDLIESTFTPEGLLGWLASSLNISSDSFVGAMLLI